MATKRGVMVVNLRVGETMELAHDHAAHGEGLDTQKISLTLLARSGQRASLAVQAADTIKVTKPAKRTAL